MHLKHLLGDELIIPIDQYYYQCLTPRGREDAYALTNELYKAKCKYVELKRGYDKSFVIMSEGRILCKLYYVKSNDFNIKMLSNNDPNEIYVNLTFEKVNIFNILTNIRDDIHLWPLYFNALKLLNEKYKGEFNNSECEKMSFNSIKKSDILKILKKIPSNFVMNDHVIIGAWGYILAVGKNDKIPINFYEILTENIEADIEKIKKIIGDEKLTIKKYNIPKIFGWCGTKYSVFYETYKIIDLYDASNDCVPFIEVKDYKVGTPFVLLKYLYIDLYSSYRLDTGNILQCKLENMINGIKKNKKLFPELSCIGSQESLEREFRIKKWNGDIKDRRLIISSYKPELVMKKSGILQTK